MYLYVFAELGIVGGAVFIAIILIPLAHLGRAIREARAVGDSQLETVGHLLLLAIVGVLAANFFLSGQFNKQLWLLLGLALSMRMIVQKRGAQRSAVAAWETRAQG